MAFGTPAPIGSGNNGVSGTIVTMASLTTVNVGDCIWVVLVADNLGTTDADHNEHTSVTDVVGNTYVKIKEFTNGNGTAGTGATVSLWMCNVTVQLVLTTGVITGTISSAVTEKSITAQACTKTAANTLAVVGTPGTDVGDNADPASMTIGSLSSQEYMFFNGIAMEQANTVTYTVDADYTAFTLVGGGIGAAGMCACGGLRVFTGTGDTYDAATNPDRDYVQIFAVIQEVAAGGAVGPLIGGKLVNHSVLQGRLLGV